MIAASDVAAVLLAAGLSQRFGSPKLSAPFRGQPLALHAATTLAEIGFGQLICVWSAGTGAVVEDIASLGYRLVEQKNPELGLGASVALGVRSASIANPRAILIALADMPLVTKTHLARLLNALSGGQDVIASSNGNTTMPPALFGADHLDSLLALTGERGARHLLMGAKHIEGAPGELLDVDRPLDAAILERAKISGAPLRSLSQHRNRVAPQKHAV